MKSSNLSNVQTRVHLKLTITITLARYGANVNDYPLSRAMMSFMTHDPRLPKSMWLQAGDHPEVPFRAEVPSARAAVPGDVLPARLEVEITDGLRRYWGESAVRSFGLELVGVPAGHEDLPPTA